MTDILDIEEAGFDAIALNLGSYETFPSFCPETSDSNQDITSDCWQQNSVELAYEAVNKLRSPVKLFLSLDMFVLELFLSYRSARDDQSCRSVWSQADSDDAQTLATLINKVNSTIGHC